MLYRKPKKLVSKSSLKEKLAIVFPKKVRTEKKVEEIKSKKVKPKK